MFWDLLWSERDADKVIIVGGKTVAKDPVPSIEMINEILQELKDEREKYGELIGIDMHN